MANTISWTLPKDPISRFRASGKQPPHWLLTTSFARHDCYSRYLMNSLSGRLAVVTGASSGIGKAIAQSLAARQASLCLAGRSEETLEAVAAGLRECSPQVFT